MNAADQRADRPLTGRHVAAMFVAGFGVIIAVNLLLAYSAIRTFPGLETDSSYVASQTFDADRAAQDALGWTVETTHSGGILRLKVTDTEGRPVRPEIVTATLGRATTMAADRTPDFRWDGVALTAAVALAPGNWNLRIDLRADDDTPFRRRIPLRVAR